jgi:hypothetical protein
VSPMKQLLIPVVCAGLLAPALPVAPAQATSLPKAGISAAGSVTLVGRRGRGWRGRHHRHHGHGAAGIIGAIIAGTLIAAAIREGRADKADLRQCDEDFPDFDYETGTYIDRYGDERVCPYLR